MKNLALMILAGAAVTAPAYASTSSTRYVGHELAAQARITITQARAAALKARPGRITDQELEKEGGGSGLRYSFDVVDHGKTVEVGIDAADGKVLENGVESAAHEAGEATTAH